MRVLIAILILIFGIRAVPFADENKNVKQKKKQSGVEGLEFVPDPTPPKSGYRYTPQSDPDSGWIYPSPHVDPSLLEGPIYQQKPGEKKKDTDGDD